MATPPNKATANTDAQTALDAIQAAADQAFIDDAAAAILEAIDQGKFEVSLTTGPDVNTKAIFDYFVALGYTVTYPGQNMLAGNRQPQPAELFGEAWEEFWENGIPPAKGPVRLTLFWVTP